MLLAVAALAVVMAGSLALGTRPIALSAVWEALAGNGQGQDARIVTELRVPRTLLGLVAGIALGLAGTLMQALTRNPLADPGLLGINAGAAAAVVLAIRVLGISSVAGYIWFAFAGAAAAFTMVYLLGTRGRAGASPQRLVLAGAAVGATLLSLTNAVALLDVTTFDRYRRWVVGTVANSDLSVVAVVSAFVAVGVVISLVLARPLNALALGEATAHALGANVARTRVWTAVAITVLCGAATAACGPIVFLGLAVPHVARALVGPDQRWLLPYSLVLAPIVLIVADVIGRLVVRPGELEAGLVAAFIGAPVFLVIVLRRKMAHL